MAEETPTSFLKRIDIDLKKLLTSINVLIEIHDTIVEYEEAKNDTDRREYKKLEANFDKYIKLVTPKRAANLIFVKSCIDVDIDTLDPIGYAGVLALVRLEVEALIQ